MKKLSKRIYAFLDKYAGVRPDWNNQTDDEDDKYTSPDATIMRYCADMLRIGVKPTSCNSEWGGGGYRPYSSKEGRDEHDFLVKEIYKVINNQRNTKTN